MNRTPLSDALDLSECWRAGLDLHSLMESELRHSGVLAGTVDVVAVGKCATEMANAARTIIGDRLRRGLVIGTHPMVPLSEAAWETLVGEHPIPGPGSLASARRLLVFLSESTAEATLFLVSGGASSLCALPEAPLTTDDLEDVWRAALETGADITALNQLRAATSSIAGGAVLRHVRTPRSRTLVMVDNVISGAAWVGSGLTYNYAPTIEFVETLCASMGVADSSLAERIADAARSRRHLMEIPVASEYENAVLVEPRMMLDLVAREATQRGYRVVNFGAALQGDVSEIAGAYAATLHGASETAPVCVVGVGEVTIRLETQGRGGRCQELAWMMAEPLSQVNRPSAFVARASDGRDFLEGVAGAWVETETMGHINAAGLDWSSVLRAHDSFQGLTAIGQVLDGSPTGWNLCDLYLLVIG